jgi:hypothetical protein
MMEWLNNVAGPEFCTRIDKQFGFIQAVEDGHLSMAQWLKNLGEVDNHIDNEAPFR